MKEIFKKITTSLLAFLVLFSTVSFTVEKHYCGSFLVDVAVFSEVKGCGMERMDASNDTLQKTCNTFEITKKSCCKDEKIVFEGQDELKIALDSLELPQQVFFTAFLLAYPIIISDREREEIHFKEYDPPNLVYDFQILHETFLI